MNEGNISSLLLFWLDLAVNVRLAKGNHNNTTCLQVSIKMKMVIFVFVVVVAARLFCCCLGRCQSIVCVACPASVARMMRGASITWLYFLSFFRKFLNVCFVLISTFLSREIWGVNMPNLPEVSHLENLLVFGCICRTCVVAIDASCDNDCRHGMSIVVILTMSSQHLGSICWQGCLVALRLITTALLVLLEECLSCECFGASQWWHWLCPLWLVIVLIFLCTHCNWQWHCCLLSLVATVPSYDACIVFTARIINSLITIQTTSRSGLRLFGTWTDRQSAQYIIIAMFVHM